MGGEQVEAIPIEAGNPPTVGADPEVAFTVPKQPVDLHIRQAVPDRKVLPHPGSLNGLMRWLFGHGSSLSVPDGGG